MLKYARFCRTCQLARIRVPHAAYLVQGQALASHQLLRTRDHALLGPHAGPTQPLLLEHGDDVVIDRRAVAVLVVRGATRITEDYAVVGRVRLAVARLALGRQQRLGRLPALDALRGLGDRGHKGDGLVDAAPRLGARGQRRVRRRDVRVVVVGRRVVVAVGAFPLAASAAASPPSPSAPSARGAR